MGAGSRRGAGRARDVEQAAGRGQASGEKRCAPGVQVGLAGQLDIERSSRRAAARSSGGASLPTLEAKATCPRSRSTLARCSSSSVPGLGGGQQPEGFVELACLQASLGGQQSPIGAPGRVQRQSDRSLQERRGRAQPTARPGPAGRPFELGGDGFVRSRAQRRRGARPGGRGRPRGRWPRPGPGGPPAARSAGAER